MKKLIYKLFPILEFLDYALGIYTEALLRELGYEETDYEKRLREMK